MHHSEIGIIVPQYTRYLRVCVESVIEETNSQGQALSSTAQIEDWGKQLAVDLMYAYDSNQTLDVWDYKKR